MGTSCTILLGVNIFRGWSSYVGPVERAEGVYGYLLGVWVVPRHPIRGYQSYRAAWGRGNGSQLLLQRVVDYSCLQTNEGLSQIRFFPDPFCHRRIVDGCISRAWRCVHG